MPAESERRNGKQQLVEIISHLFCLYPKNNLTKYLTPGKNASAWSRKPVYNKENCVVLYLTNWLINTPDALDYSSDCQSM